jgi:hypothetical protein
MINAVPVVNVNMVIKPKTPTLELDHQTLGCVVVEALQSKMRWPMLCTMLIKIVP